MKKVVLVYVFLNACYVIAYKRTSCELNIDNCNYTVSLSPSNSCHGDHTNRRHRRSTNSKIEISPELAPVVSIISKRIKKIQNKLTRDMEALSTRVLRGVRKIETLMSEDSEKQATKRGVSNSVGSCPPGFVTLDRWPYCYMFSKFNTTWYEARDFCAAFNSDMVALGSLKEHYIVAFLIKNDIEISEAKGWWTSGTFVRKTKQWMWTSDIDMRPFTFIKWAASEPNETSLQCVLLHRDDDHLWHDDLCTMRYNFICEVSIG